MKPAVKTAWQKRLSENAANAGRLLFLREPTNRGQTNETGAERQGVLEGIYYSALTSSCNSLVRRKVDRKYALSPDDYDGSRSYRTHAVACHLPSR